MFKHRGQRFVKNDLTPILTLILTLTLTLMEEGMQRIVLPVTVKAGVTASYEPARAMHRGGPEAAPGAVSEEALPEHGGGEAHSMPHGMVGSEAPRATRWKLTLILVDRKHTCASTTPTGTLILGRSRGGRLCS